MPVTKDIIEKFFNQLPNFQDIERKKNAFIKEINEKEENQKRFVIIKVRAEEGDFGPFIISNLLVV